MGVLGASMAAADLYGADAGAVAKVLSVVASLLGAPLMLLMYLPPSSFGNRWWGDDSNFILGLAAVNALLWGWALTTNWRRVARRH